MRAGTNNKRVLPPTSALIDEITTIVSTASAAILAIDISTLVKRIKPDRSPLTAPDDASQSVILAGLSRLFPSIPIISEEVNGAGQISGPDATFFLVDPLDGTREFVAGRDEYTLNVALVHQSAAVFGCISAPAFGLIWRGVPGQGAERLELTAGANANTCRARTPLRTRKGRGPRRSVPTARADPRVGHCSRVCDRCRRWGYGC
jgi:3'(2'), 5'-bisphosphate nucleotidase